VGADNSPFIGTEAPQRPGDAILVEGARENNLRDVSLAIPKGKITVFTGVSGSGKSSLVFDTIAVESQRQLNETYPGFIRYRLPTFERPHFDRLENLSAAIVVDQRPIGRNSRSTVGTMTDVHPILRILFSRHGEPSAGESTAYSFNDPRGMCPECEGTGRTRQVDLAALIDEERSLNEAAIRFPAFEPRTVEWQFYAESGLFDPDKPLGDYSAQERETLLYGEGFKVPRRTRTGTVENNYQGVVRRLERLYLRKELPSLSAKNREAIGTVARERTCPGCGGARLNQAALASRIDGVNIAELAALEIGEAIAFLGAIDDPVANPIAASALAVLGRIEAIGLGYLSLERETPTLSGGEAQRLKTVRFLGSSLTGMTYIFDEPSVGLHPRDVDRLNDLLRALRDKGNTVLVVEHDREVIAVADHVVDLGPWAGEEGGEIVFEGTVEELGRAETLTAERLRAPRRLTGRRRTASGEPLRIEGANRNNLGGVDVAIPGGVLTVVTGVAGSGKSTLFAEVLPEQHPEVRLIDQSAVGLSPRSTPASYAGAMDGIRAAFAAASGARASLFSFNSAGACPECKGRGVIRTDLAFMDPVTVTCESCGGTRFNDEALSHRLRGRTIADVLGMTIAEALEFLEEAELRGRLSHLAAVGLGYLRLGQPLGSLSGGERQRLKLARRLEDGAGTYVFDEPSNGLHMADVATLLGVFDRLVDGGSTVIAVEHDLDVIEHADWVIDVGPEAGRHGGRIVFEGTPKELLEDPHSHTAEFLRRDLAG
jgi:excinuclease ABC A subunit